MTKEEKELLFQDICARLPYEVKGRVYAETTNGKYDISGNMIFFDSPFDVTLDTVNTSTEELHVVAIGNEDTVDFIEGQQACETPYTIDDFKQYLRPMSSMTEKELKEFSYTILQQPDLDAVRNWQTLSIDLNELTKVLDWLNKKHFDYRDLIKKGLAIEAPEGIYE